MDHLRELQTVMQRLADNIDAPTAPTAIAVRQGAGKTVEIVVTFSEPADWGTTELWRSTTNDVTTATLIASNKSHSFHDVNVAYGSTYYYFSRVVGMSGTSSNTSGWSPSSGHSILVAQVATADIGAGAVGTTEIASNAVTGPQIATGAVGSPQIADLAVGTAEIAFLAVGTLQIAGVAVTTAKRQTANSVSGNITISAGSTGSKGLTHNLGVIPSVAYDMGVSTWGIKLTWFPGAVSTTDAYFEFYNHDTVGVTVTVTLYFW